MARLPSERITDNALGALQMVGARRLARPRLPGSKPGGSAIPHEPRAGKMASLTGFAPVISCMRGRHVDWTTPQGQNNGEGKRICTFDLMHVTHPLWLAELCPRKWWGRRVLPSLPLACQTSALLVSYTPMKSHPWPVSSTGSHPAGRDRSSCFAFRGKIHCVNLGSFSRSEKLGGHGGTCTPKAARF